MHFLLDRTSLVAIGGGFVIRRSPFTATFGEVQAGLGDGIASTGSGAQIADQCVASEAAGVPLG